MSLDVVDSISMTRSAIITRFYLRPRILFILDRHVGRTGVWAEVFFKLQYDLHFQSPNNPPIRTTSVPTLTIHCSPFSFIARSDESYGVERYAVNGECLDEWKTERA